MSEEVLKVVALNKHFGGIHVTNDVNFSLQAGEKTAIIGPNGAGKSTLFNLLTGYHRPDSGTVYFCGEDITHKAPHTICDAGISRAFQISNIFPKMTVFENVRVAVHTQMGQSLTFFSRADQIGVEETQEVLSRCNMLSRRDVLAGQLSQGDKKKLELALALAGKPKLMFLDEPTAGMSLEETHETMTLVDNLNADLGLTILFTEHDMSVVFNHSERVMLLNRGEIIVEGTPTEIRENPTVQKIYLGEHH